MKLIRKLSFFPPSMIMLLAICLGLWGCEQEDIFENTQAEYLELNTYETSKMSEQDFQKMFEAIKRMDVRQKHGEYHIKQTSATQINISEELFVFIKNGFDYTNKLYKSGNSNSSKFSFLRLKMSTAEGDQSSQTPTDCMAHSIAAMAGKPLSTVKGWLQNQYGTDGVPFNSFQAACAQFTPSGTYGENGYTLPHGNLNNTVIVIQNGTHAVNAIYYDSGSGVIVYQDNQAIFYGNGSDVGYISPGQVVRYYSKN